MTNKLYDFTPDHNIIKGRDPKAKKVVTTPGPVSTATKKEANDISTRDS